MLLSFSDVTLAIRAEIACLREGHDEYHSNLFAPMVGSVDTAVLVFRSLNVFLTSGSSQLRIVSSSLGVSHKRSEPLSQHDCMRDLSGLSQV